MNAITPLTKIQQALSRAVTPEQSKAVEAMAAAAQAWAKEQDDYELVVEAGKVYILARRKTTELIEPHIRQGQHGRENDTNVLFISDYGFTDKQWFRRKKELEVMESDIFDYLDDCIEKKSEPTIAGLLRYANDPTCVHVSDDSYEWYTPKEYIEAVRDVLGWISLDPASCEEANEIVKAETFFTKKDDGLSQDWFGRVFLNPPYNMPLVEQFTARAIREYENGDMEEAIVLVNNATDTGWFQTLLDSYPACFTRGRVKFWTSEGPNLGARQGQVFFYLGHNPAKFTEVFNQFGIVVRKYDHQ